MFFLILKLNDRMIDGSKIVYICICESCEIVKIELLMFSRNENFLCDGIKLFTKLRKMVGSKLKNQRTVELNLFNRFYNKSKATLQYTQIEGGTKGGGGGGAIGVPLTDQSSTFNLCGITMWHS